MNTDITPQKALNRKGWKVLFLALLTLVGTVVIQAVGLIATVIVRVPENGLAFATIFQAFSAGSIMLGMLVLGGAAWLKPSRDDAREALRIGRFIIIADVVLMIVATIGFFVEGSTVAPDWPLNLVMTAFLCLCIGIAEEVMFRGVILNAVLAVMGRSHRGTMGAIAFVSVMFGFAHVNVATDFADPLLATQAVLKIVQTGLFSVILCSVVLRTHRLGGAALFHGLSDFLIMIPSIVLAGGQLNANYVHTGEEGIAGIVVYAVAIALYLPFAIKAIRRMRREHVAYRGVFMERTLAKQDADAHPTATTGLPTAA